MTLEFDVLETTVLEIHDAMEAGEVTSRELVEQYLERIEAYDRDGPELNAIITVNPDARERADELDEKFTENGFVGPLHGVPVLVKDQAETAGITTTFGSEAFDDYVPERNATIVTNLEEAGAIVLAKTNLPDWASSWFGTSSVIGRTKNPYALDRDPGGSSAGTGAGVAANLGTVGIGEDTGGSIRLPSSFCNLFGIRVTTGLISRTGLAPLVTRQDTAGPMARTVRDMALLLDVLVGYDADDEWTAATELARVEGSYVDHLDEAGLEGARIGVLRDAFGSDDDPNAAPVNDVVEQALEELVDAGAELVDPVSVPDLMGQIEETMLYVLQSKHDLDQFLADREDAPVGSVEEIYESGQYYEGLDLLEAIAEGPADPADEPGYWRKVAAQGSFRRDLLYTIADHDLDAILFPDVQVVPPTDAELGETYTTATFPTNTVIGAQTLCPAVSIPGGFTDDGVPVGVELLGRPYDEPRLLELAYAYEQAVDPRRSPETAPALGEE
ncbi:amidase [Natribaculum luteum]|uniref:Amidase n=1 Tax=Natribaculum luteum TaxID=1586232 RepID=A0ABD5P573_9EURY|nr:amidase family protein [Natribaculum luteum]